MKKLDTYFMKKSIDYTGKICAVTGATGSLGFHTSRYLLLKGAEVILIGRSKAKLDTALSKLKEEFKDSKISYLICDFSNLEDTKHLVETLKPLKINYLFNNAGVYHLPVKMIGKHDITFITNFLSPYILTKELCENDKDLVVTQTASVSYRYTKIDVNDVEFIKKSKTKTARYGNSKRLFLISTLKLQNSLQNSIYLAHPGISATSLFNSSKGGFNKAFNKLIVPIMKLIFMKPEKAALSIALAPSFNYRKNRLIGPGGFCHSWGYPKSYNIKDNYIEYYELLIINNIIKEALSD